MKMMFNRNILSVLICILLCHSNLRSQDSIINNDFTPHGRAVVKIFTNFHAGISGSDDKLTFEVNRAFLGYKYYLHQYFSAEVKLDIGSVNDELTGSIIGRHAFFKNAYVRYRKNGLEIDFGLIDMHAFKIQEKEWDHRYIAKSFQDEYGLNPSADLGASLIYKVCDLFSFDISASNGEGYKHLQDDNTIKGGTGVTFTPIKGLKIRGYYDISMKGVTQSTLSSFIGYTHNEKFNLSAEYNYQLNSGFLDDHNLGGISVYSYYNINSKFQIFGRYDMFNSATLDSDTLKLNNDRDGRVVIAGIQYHVIKQLKIALDYQGRLPANSGFPNLSYIYLNLEVKLD